MTRNLRERDPKHKHGLVLANGGNMTYQHVLLLSAEPPLPDRVYPERNPIPDVVTDVPVPVVEEVAEGEAVVEVRFYFICFACLLVLVDCRACGLDLVWVLADYLDIHR